MTEQIECCYVRYGYGKNKNKGEIKMGNFMTNMETMVMNLTGCCRQVANNVVNTILNEDLKANNEEKLPHGLSLKEDPEDNMPILFAELATVGEDAILSIARSNGESVEIVNQWRGQEAVKLYAELAHPSLFNNIHRLMGN